jgi:rhodanese-related sulfurtransferase
MKRLVLLFALLVRVAFAAEKVEHIAPTDAARLVAAGQAVLVDIREPAEWLQTGVAEPAVLLPKSEFDDGMLGEWRRFLKNIGEKKIILYCRSGRRAADLGAALAERGYKVVNAGGFKDWTAAGLPVRKYEGKK